MARKASQAGIPVDKRSRAAELVRYASRRRALPVAAIDAPGRPPSPFVANELLVGESRPELVERLIGDFGAERVPWPALPAPPTGLAGRRAALSRPMPLPARLRFAVPPGPSGSRGIARFRDEFGADASVSSEMGAAVLALAASFAAQDRPVGLNAIGAPEALPLVSATEGLGGSPFSWPSFAGPARVTAAWQLVEAYRAVRQTPQIVVGILDGGFWLNDWLPAFPDGQTASDFGPSVAQCNLRDEGVPAGGENPNVCGWTNWQPNLCPWHGNGVASVACAQVGNHVGAAGVGGTVSVPLLFRSDLSVDEILRCLHLCVGWGVHIVNMSFTIRVPSWWLTEETWDNSFQFAADHGLVIVCAAGNQGDELPGDGHIFATPPRPATRTPGTITVGALDTANQARADSNYGSSLNIWAPGEKIPVAPDGDHPNGSEQSGTSIAAPFVSGVAAMMRAVNPDLDTFGTNSLLTSSGWKGTGRVGVGVNAFAAVLKAMGGRLPHESGGPNDAPGLASPLYPGGPAGALIPRDLPLRPGFGVLATNSDQDWYRFQLSQYSRCVVDLQFYHLLGDVALDVHAGDPDSRLPGDLTRVMLQGRRVHSALMAPDEYKLHVRGSMNLYQLLVRLQPEPLQPDEFEPNEDFAHATLFRLSNPGSPSGPFVPADLSLAHGPGRYDLTLPHGDMDYFRIKVDIAGSSIFRAIVSVGNTDAPVTVRAFDGKRVLQREFKNVRSAKLDLTESADTFIQVFTPGQTRYVLTVGFEVDPAALPPLLQEKPVFTIPDLLTPKILIEEITHFAVVLPRSRELRRPIAFAARGPGEFRMDLLDGAGQLVREGRIVEDGIHSHVAVETEGLPDGMHFVRLSPTRPQSGEPMPRLYVDRVPGRIG